MIPVRLPLADPESLTWTGKKSWIYPARLLLPVANDKSSKLNGLYSALTGTIRTPLACAHAHLAGPVHRWGEREGGAHLWVSTTEKPMLRSDNCQPWASKLKPKMPWPNLMLSQEHRPRAVWVIEMLRLLSCTHTLLYTMFYTSLCGLANVLVLLYTYQRADLRLVSGGMLEE